MPLHDMLTGMSPARRIGRMNVGESHVTPRVSRDKRTSQIGMLFWGRAEEPGLNSG